MKQYMDKELSVKLNGNRTVTGTLRSLAQRMLHRIAKLGDVTKTFAVMALSDETPLFSSTRQVNSFSLAAWDNGPSSLAARLKALVQGEVEAHSTEIVA